MAAITTEEPNDFEVANRWDKAWRLQRWATEQGETMETVAAWEDRQWASALAAIQHQTSRNMRHPSDITKGVVIGLMLGASRRG